MVAFFACQRQSSETKTVQDRENGAKSEVTVEPEEKLRPSAPGKRDSQSDDTCKNMTRNSRIALCGPASGQEVWGYLRKKLGVTEVVFRFEGECFSSIGPEGTTSFVPPLEAKCYQGPKKQCIQTDSPKEPWEYRFPAEEPAWAKLVEHGWKVRQDAWTHMRVSWEKQGEECVHRVRGLADMDGDGIYSTYEGGAVTRGDKFLRKLEPIEVPE